MALAASASIPGGIGHAARIGSWFRKAGGFRLGRIGQKRPLARAGRPANSGCVETVKRREKTAFAPFFAVTKSNKSMR